MLEILCTIVVVFLITSFFGYVVHWSLHQPWTGSFNEKHMTHHLKLYPPADYQSDKYRRAGTHDTFKTFLLASIPLIAAPIILGIYGVLPLSLVITTLIVMGIMGFLHDYLHDSFHINNHFLTRVPIFRGIFKYWNQLHYLHHVDMQVNYGIFIFLWDRLFGTFWKFI